MNSELLAEATIPPCDPYATTPVSDDVPGPNGQAQPRFGRYQVTDLLGEGGYGRVYRGYDPELRRVVAIKVPRRERIETPADAEAYLTEARVLAGLDHFGIVPVHDVGRADDGLCYMVSKFMPTATWPA